MTKLQKIILLFLFIGICVFGILSAGMISQLWLKPLGPSLQLPANTYLPAATFPPTWTPFVEENLAPGHPSTGTPAPAATATATPRTAVCGGPDAMMILAIGSDQRGDSYLYGLGDVIRLVRVDFLNPGVSIMSLPRDLYVEIPGISDHYDITHGKLNQSYLYGNPGFGYYDGAGLGPGLMARTLAHNFGAQPDQYIAVNMQTFVNIVNAVDGITVTLDETIDGRAADQTSRDDLVFYAGTHYLSGKEALQLARLRPYGVFNRAKAQNEVLCGLYEKLLSPSVVGNIPGVINSFENNVQTDLSPAQIGQLTCLATQLDGSNITFYNWPEDIFVGTRVDDPVLGRTFIWDVDFDLMRSYIDAFSRGEWLATVQSESTETEEFPPTSFCD
ncbi:MAG: LCP family protein [Anaerolineae bacterium]|nr:LCP family protein [Anaerolineae bacterium]MBT7070382.1 LCP family protein [Anaerolineae bacterium]MBT7324424.1 LCP family protein [Anaerolineae bacterium]